jgi:hypothetical protein
MNPRQGKKELAINPTLTSKKFVKPTNVIRNM